MKGAAEEVGVAEGEAGVAAGVVGPEAGAEGDRALLQGAQRHISLILLTELLQCLLCTPAHPQGRGLLCEHRGLCCVFNGVKCLFVYT